MVLAFFRNFFKYCLRALLWCAIGSVCLLAIGLGVAAYGLDGALLQPALDATISRDVGKLSVRRAAFRLTQGVVLRGITFHNNEGKLVARCAKSVIGIRLFSREAWCDRVSALTVDDLFVAQLDPSPSTPGCEMPPPEERYIVPDLSHIVLPRFDHVPLRFTNLDVLEVRLNTLTGTLHTQGGKLLFRNLVGDVDGETQKVDGRVDVDVHGGTVSAKIRGFIFQTRVNGIYRALDFPIIETYSNNFTLAKPAWADCAFTVGFDKYRNIFDLKVNIVAQQGAYCGVAFDKACGTIHCHGIWDAVTTISPITAWRDERILAEGSLRFDCPNDRFSFETTSQALSPEEMLRLIDMPFTEAIPTMTAEAPPALSLKGHLPIFEEQTPSKVDLDGTVAFGAPFTFDQLRVRRGEATISMREGCFTLGDLTAQMPLGGTVKGLISVKIPETAEYTDVTTRVTLKDVSLADILKPFGMDALSECLATGKLFLEGRTDETLLQSIQADYDLVLHGGLIGRIPLFAGFTDLIANTIPGVSILTDTTTATLVGTAQDGIFTLPHVTLFGTLFMIEGEVSYDLPKDKLSAQIVAGVFKEKTILGTLTRWAIVPITKLLWEIHVDGPIGAPSWEHRTIVGKIWDNIPFIGNRND